MKIQRFNIFSEERGDLVPIEFSNLPFAPQRVFWVTNVPKGEERGKHAHYCCKQYLLCIKGQIIVKLFDGLKVSGKALFPGEGVLVDNMMWDSQIFVTGDDILLVFASLPYDKMDYILDRQDFIKLKQG